MQLALQIAAVGQMAIALLNLALNRIMGWGTELERMPLLLKEVHQVHSWFISVTLAIFSVLTWRFAGELSINPIGRWLAVGIGIFWGFRTVLQIAYYSSSHWRGRTGRTAIHILLLMIYGGFTALYLWTAFAGQP